MSRHAAEEAIKKGLVRVNGEVVSEGERIIPGVDLVEYNGVPVIPSADKKTYVLLNKPRGFVTTLSDEKGRRTVAELVASVGTRIYPVGRLDMDSDGLLLFTDDGELTNKLTHPRHEIPKIYHVTVSGKVSREKIDALSSPMIIDGYKILPVKTRVIDEGVSSSTLEMTLYEGRNRQIRKMCAAVGLTVKRLSRVSIGKLKLNGLAVGAWRYLDEKEVDYLKRCAEKKRPKN